MPNTLGTLSGSLILQEALSLVFKKFPVLNSISKDLAPLGALQNQTVITRLKSIPSVVDGNADLPDFATTDVPVTLSYSKKIGASFTADQYNSTNRDLIQELAEPIAIGMAQQIVGSVAALWTTSNFANETVNASPDYTTLVACRQALTERGIHGTRHAIVTPGVYSLLLEDPRCNRFYKSFLPPGEDPVLSGELSQISGFSTIQEYPDLPLANHLIGVALTPEAVVLASRAPMNPQEAFGSEVPFAGTFDIITDPNTGFSAAAVQYIDPKTLSVNVYMKWIYGVAVGNNLALQRIVSSSNS
jgi:hypothetical protein